MRQRFAPPLLALVAETRTHESHFDTARIGINPKAVWLGSMSFEAGKSRPVEMMRVKPDGARIVGSITIANGKAALVGFEQIDAIERRLRALEARR